MTDYLAASAETEGGSPMMNFGGVLLAGVPEPEDWTRAFKLLSNADWASAAKVCAVMADAKAAKATMEKLNAAVVVARQEIAKAEAAAADLARQRLELRKAAAAQAEELKRLRGEFEAQLAVDRANHVAKTQEHERALAAKRDQFAALLDNAAAG